MIASWVAFSFAFTVLFPGVQQSSTLTAADYLVLVPIWLLAIVIGVVLGVI